ncbi:CBASS oligonucleotide cyclase [Halorubrum sp. SS7]|uniref:CBASS oligonucleotide cyclase n=3 Tax=unclassified Halorubrum TaxID=2642239 RepID=UPI001F5426B6|nr:CBASS oligonucleotide cyclase [Halorubrum sp. SS7]
MGNTRTVGEYQQGGDGSNRSPANSNNSDVGDSSRDAEREIEESHQEYAEEAQITDKQAKDMQQRRENVVDNLKEEGLSIEEDHIYGSVMQGTMTGPLDEDCDIDVMIVLDADEHGQWATSRNGPQNALRAVKRRLEQKYPNQEVRIDRNVVAVKFSDFTVEVTPAFRYSDTHNPESPTDPVTIGGMETPIQPMGADDPNNGYAIPDTYGGQSWVGTNPRKFQSMYNAVNENNGGNLQRVAVSAKKWNEENGKPVNSYHMVMMAYKYFRNDAPAGASTHEHMSNFFRNLPQYVNDETREPVYQERVDNGMSSKEKKQAAQKAYRASEKIEEAERLKQEGKTQEAKEKYREVYGDDFK